MGGYFCTTESFQVEGVSAWPGAQCGDCGPANQPTQAAALRGMQPLPKPITNKPAIDIYKLTDTLRASTAIIILSMNTKSKNSFSSILRI